MKLKLSSMVAGLVFASGAGPALANTNDWRFDTNSNPSLPVGAMSSTSVARVIPGEFASGWVLNNQVLGSARGIWDLGRNGTIVLSNAVTTPAARRFIVKVTQWNDGGIYQNMANVSVAGAQLVRTGPLVDATELNDGTTIGGWVIHESEWEATSPGLTEPILITGAYFGTLVDSVSVASPSTEAGAPLLTITRASTNAGTLHLSWPSLHSTMVLESSLELGGASSWSAVGGSPQTVGDRIVMTVEVAGDARFYRLRQP